MSRKISRTRHWSPTFPMMRNQARPARLRPTFRPFPDTTHARDYEYKRHGTVTAGMDLVTGHQCGGRPAPKSGVHRLSPSTRRQLLSHNQTSVGSGQAHTSRETLAFLATLPNRFEFVFTPKHGLNLVESFFSKVARTLLRGIRVASKEELVERAVYRPTGNLLCSSGPTRWTTRQKYRNVILELLH